MGFATNFLTVATVIDNVYAVDLQITQLTQQKFQIADTSRQLSIGSLADVARFTSPLVAFYKEQLTNQEREVDKQLEYLRALRTSYQSMKEEAQKYVSESIKNTFKNNYM